MKPQKTLITIATLALSVGGFGQTTPPDVSVAFAGGASSVDGDGARFQKHFQHRRGGFGGVQDFQYLKEGEDSFFRLNGGVVAGNADIRLDARWEKYDSHYLWFGYKQFRTWYDGSGGYLPANDLWISLYDEEMHLDRGQLWVEFGLIPADRPHLRVRYQRLTRKGRKDSTTWGDTALTGGSGLRSIVPTYLDLDETRDIVAAEIMQQSGEYVWEAGVRYDGTKLNNSRNANRRPGESSDRKVVTRDGTEADLFSAYGYSMRNFGENLTISASGSYMTLDTNLEGSRIYGDTYDPVFDPEYGKLQFRDRGFLELAGGSKLKQLVANGNLQYRAGKHWKIRTSLRLSDKRTDGVSRFTEWDFGSSLSTNVVEMEAASRRDVFDAVGDLEVFYSGLKNWTLTLRGEWIHGSGDLAENKVEIESDTINVDRLTNDERRGHKYSLGANWYASSHVTIAGQVYFRSRENSFDHVRDSSPPTASDRYPAFIENQEFETVDANIRLSWRPLSNLNLVTRFDRRSSDVTSRMMSLNSERSADLKSRILSQSVTYSPVPRLYLTGSINITRDFVETPAEELVGDSQNDYVVGTLGAGYAVNDRNDVTIDYFYFDADNFADNSANSQPYNAGETRHAISGVWRFQYSENLLYTAKYAFATNRDQTSGGNNDYDAHTVYGSVQYRF